MRALLEERLRLVTEAGALNGEHVRLLQRAAGAEIDALAGKPDAAAPEAELEAVAVRLRRLEARIETIDRRLAGG